MISKEQISAGMISFQLCCILYYISSSFAVQKDILEIFHTAGGNELLLRTLLHLESNYQNETEKDKDKDKDKSRPISSLIFAIADFSELKCNLPNFNYFVMDVKPIELPSTFRKLSFLRENMTADENVPLIQNYEVCYFYYDLQLP